MKKIISGLCAISIFFSTGSAFVTYEIPTREEKIIPINYISSKDETLESIDLSEYKDVEIVDYKMTKGKAIFEIENDELILDLYDGENFNGETTQEKVKTEEIKNLILQNNKAIFIPEEEIKNIIEVDGDFSEGRINGDKVILELKKDAIGTNGYNKDKIVKSKLTIEVDKNNSEKTVYSEFYALGEEMPDNAKIKIKDVNLDGDATVDINNNDVRILFENGTPNIEEITKHDGYGYYWIDRALDGTFRDKYPNSIYRTDKYYFEGRGAYIDDERLIIEREFEDSWKDYVGFVLGGQKYVFLLSDVPENLFEGAVILKEKSNNFKATSFSEDYKLDWMNTDELTVEITDNSVRYIPEGNLYSMGELVAYSEGWGETVPNKSDESTESFFNIISGKMETYVKHFKFFYGPKEKETFGGTITYPYKATIEYEHYEPTSLYSGSITYTYEEIIEDRGYEFSGWVKISYLTEKTINDYPPAAPFNVCYDTSTEELSWQPAVDDYTKPEDMRYEVEVEAGDSFYKVSTTKNGETKIKYENGFKKKFRVRAIDNQNQFSEWAYFDDSSIEIVGSIEPQEVFAGESIDITATVKSFKDIKSVQAYSEELNIDEELIKKSEKVPNAIEISFNLLNYAGKEPWLIVDDMYYATVDNENIKIKNYPSDAETERTIMNIDLPENILFDKNGTIILPNQNYMNIPIEITSFNENIWYFYSSCSLNFVNKNTKQEEIFIQFENDNKASLVGKKEKIEITPYIKINLFDYTNGKAKYEEIPITSDIATKPIAVSWISKDNTTDFVIYIDGEYFYSYKVNTDNVINNIESFSSYTLAKRMSRMQRNSVGYQYATKSKSYNWANMYKAGDILNISWLGYKIKNKNNSEIYEKYNNLSTTRDVNRLVFLDESISSNAINLYLSKIKSTNMMIDRKNKETVLADDIQEITLEYFKNDIKIGANIKEGLYDITIVATDETGQTAKVLLPLNVKEISSIENEDIEIGRFYYANNNFNEKYVEQMSLTKYNLDTKGFISAGETLAIVINSENEISNITVDFVGDKSIKEYDNLTKKFLEENLTYDFPLTLYPTAEGVFLYTIPYGTEQTLESWATLREKSEDFENINKEKLFSRISEPYQIKIQVNGEEFVYEFDVFERWDTILNRNASKYITNSNQKWRIQL